MGESGSLGAQQNPNGRECVWQFLTFKRGTGDVMFGEPGKLLENSLKMGRKIGQPPSKWL